VPAPPRVCPCLAPTFCRLPGCRSFCHCAGSQRAYPAVCRLYYPQFSWDAVAAAAVAACRLLVLRSSRTCPLRALPLLVACHLPQPRTCRCRPALRCLRFCWTARARVARRYAAVWHARSAGVPAPPDLHTYACPAVATCTRCAGFACCNAEPALRRYALCALPCEQVNTRLW